MKNKKNNSAANSYHKNTYNFVWTAAGARLQNGTSRSRGQKVGRALPPSKATVRKRLSTRSIGVLIAIIIGVSGLFGLSFNHAAAATSEIHSGIKGYCLDDHDNGTSANNEVDAWACNNTAAQDWVATGNTIKHGVNGCLGALGDEVTLNKCTNASSQIWAPAMSGYENVNSGLCLAVPNSNTGSQLALESCQQLTEANEVWIPAPAGNNKAGSVSNLSCSVETEGERIACYASQQWAIWQTNSPSHETLLNEYSDGNGYEEWCADFVSYLYKQAGDPFTGGERDGWDEYDANNIQNMGLTEHTAGSYEPQAGDVAFFDYPGGHVEIVVIGGKNPVFVYGDSGTIDPTTGNGEMAHNSITNKPSEGQVMYYLSPTSG